MRLTRLLLAVAVVALQLARGEAYYPDLVFGGACDDKSFLNGLVFRYMGKTRSGAPFYKSLRGTEYIYYDPDCSRSGDGQGRWIIDADAPSTTQENDLDGDGICDYHGRVASPQTAYPPRSATWQLKCGGVLQEWFVILAEVTTTSTSTTVSSTTSSSTTSSSSTTRTTTSTTRTTTSTTKSTTTSTTVSSTTSTSVTSSTTTSSSTSVTSTSTTVTRTSTTSTSVTRTSTTRTTSTTSSTTATYTGTSTTKTSTSTTSLTTTSTSTTRTRTSTTSTTRTGTSTTATSTSTTVTTLTTTSSTVTQTTVTTTSTSATSTTSSTGTTTTVSTTTSTTLLTLRLNGACKFKSFLNGLTFKTQGYAANGAPFFKAEGTDQYLYYDVDCNGGSNGAARWIIDATAPDVSKSQDLDGDGECNYHARLDSNDTARPPAEAAWTVFCGVEWVEQVLTYSLPGVQGEDGQDAANGTNLTAMSSALVLAGRFCPQKAFLNGMRFILEGVTATGAPYYRAAEGGQFIYYDPSCSGFQNGTARWIIDTNAPNTTAAMDLDGDGACEYHARAHSNDTSAPPAAAMWHVYCGGRAWEDVWLTLTPGTTTPAPQMIIGSGAAGPQWRLALSLSLALLAASFPSLGR